MRACSSLMDVARIKLTKINWRRKGFAWLTGHNPLSVEVKTVTWEGGILLTSLLSMAFSTIFLIPPTWPEVALPTVDWALLYQLAINKILTQTCSQSRLMQAVPQLEFPLSRLTTKSNHQSDYGWVQELTQVSFQTVKGKGLMNFLLPQRINKQKLFLMQFTEHIPSL